MNGALLLLGVSAYVLLGCRFYTRWMERMRGTDPSKPTPAVAKNDGCDYVPAHPAVLFGYRHFAAIAGEGTRLVRFGWQGFVGHPEARPSIVKKGAYNVYVGTFVVCALVAGLLLGEPKVAKQFCPLFGGANQFLASLTLLTAMLWLVGDKRPGWQTAIPMVFVLGASAWGLSAIFTSAIRNGQAILFASPGFLLGLAAVLAVIAVPKGRKAAV